MAGVGVFFGIRVLAPLEVKLEELPLLAVTEEPFDFPAVEATVECFSISGFDFTRSGIFWMEVCAFSDEFPFGSESSYEEEKLSTYVAWLPSGSLLGAVMPSFRLYWTWSKDWVKFAAKL